MENKLIWASSSQWPILTPTNPKGINPNTANPCSGDRKERMMMNSIKAKIKGITPAGSQYNIAQNIYAYGVEIGPDGMIYTANNTDIHRIDPVTLTTEVVVNGNAGK